MWKTSARGVCVCLILFFADCKNPFATRKPEPPKEARSSWTPPLHPEDALVNFQNAISERHVENFIRCLSDPAYSLKIYRFEPDPQMVALHPEIFTLWDRGKEQVVIQQAFSLVPADSACALTWVESIREFTTSDSAIFVRRYRLELHHRQDNPARIYEGQAEFWLAEDQRGEWTIYRWKDNAESGFQSWSVLKASLGG